MTRAQLETMNAIEAPFEKVEPDAPVYARWPELLLTSKAIERPALRPRAAKLREILFDQQRVRRRADGPYQIFGVHWEQMLSHEHARSHLLTLRTRTRRRGERPRGATSGHRAGRV